MKNDVFVGVFGGSKRGQDTAKRARRSREDHGQSVTSPATPRIPVVAGRAGWVLDRVPVRPPSINRSFSRLFLGVSCPVRLTVTRSIRRETPAGRWWARGFAKLGWTSKTSVHLKWRSMPPCNSSETTMKPPAGAWPRRAKRSDRRVDTQARGHGHAGDGKASKRPSGRAPTRRN